MNLVPAYYVATGNRARLVYGLGNALLNSDCYQRERNTSCDETAEEPEYFG